MAYDPGVAPNQGQFGFTNFNGQQTLGATPQEMWNMQTGVGQYNAATGQNLTAQQYDAMINPSSSGARWGADGSPNTSALNGVSPYVPGSHDVSGMAPGAGSAGISQMYQQLLGRAPDASGLQFYANNLANGSTTMQGIHDAIMNSPEYAQSQSGGAAGGGYGTSSNPYLGRQADAIRAQQAQLFGDMNNQITSGAVAAGGLGGTRQGVAQGVAEGRAATGMDSALANLYGNDWNADQNRALSQYGMDQNFYSQQRGLDQSGAMLGANLWNLGVNGAWNPINNANNVYKSYTGFGTDTTSQGGGTQGAFGGALSAAALGKSMGWWG